MNLSLKFLNNSQIEKEQSKNILLKFKLKIRLISGLNLKLNKQILARNI